MRGLIAATLSGPRHLFGGVPMEFQAVVDAVRSWSVEDRVRLVDVIEAEIRSLTPAQIKEVKRRLAAYDADPSIGIAFDEFTAHIENQLAELGE
jgi:putative addiction module component (TIGR02574 family)